MDHVIVVVSLSTQPEGATSEEEVVHLPEEGLAGSRVDRSGSTGTLQPREQDYYQGKMSNKAFVVLRQQIQTVQNGEKIIRGLFK